MCTREGPVSDKDGVHRRMGSQHTVCVVCFGRGSPAAVWPRVRGRGIPQANGTYATNHCWVMDLKDGGDHVGLVCTGCRGQGRRFPYRLCTHFLTLTVQVVR